jgi:adenosylcobyric acid synthase
MHLGVTQGGDCARPFLTIDGVAEGAVSADGRVAGVYLHGLFAADGWRRAFLSELGAESDPGFFYERGIEATLDRLAGHLERHLDFERLWRIARDLDENSETTSAISF